MEENMVPLRADRLFRMVLPRRAAKVGDHIMRHPEIGCVYVDQAGRMLATDAYSMVRVTPRAVFGPSAPEGLYRLKDRRLCRDLEVEQLVRKRYPQRDCPLFPAWPVDDADKAMRRFSFYETAAADRWKTLNSILLDVGISMNIPRHWPLLKEAILKGSTDTAEVDTRGEDRPFVVRSRSEGLGISMEIVFMPLPRTPASEYEVTEVMQEDAKCVTSLRGI